MSITTDSLETKVKDLNIDEVSHKDTVKSEEKSVDVLTSSAEPAKESQPESTSTSTSNPTPESSGEQVNGKTSNEPSISIHLSSNTDNPENANSQDVKSSLPSSLPFSEDMEKVITVLHDPLNFNAKHPLYDTWTLWFDNSGKKASAKDWSDNIKEIITFDSVEEFWGLYNNIVKVSNLSIGMNYYLFKAGIRPEWEDPANSKGGRLFVQLMRNNHLPTIDNTWLNTILAAIGESFDVQDEVTGISMSVRKSFFRVAIWTRTSEDRVKLEKIGKQFRDSLKVKQQVKVEFHAHAVAQGSGKSNDKNQWII